MRVGLLLAALLLPAACATTPPIEGDFGVICLHELTGDYRGFRLHIDGEAVTLAFCDSECARYAVSNVQRKGRTIAFDAESKSTRRERMSLPVRLSFTATQERDGLMLRADGDRYDIEPELVPRAGHGTCPAEWGVARPLSLEPYTPD